MVRSTKIFVSHSTAETEFARELANRLTAAGFRVWYDVDVPAGGNWAKETGKALDEAEAMVVLLSPEAIRSRWVNREIEYALTNERFEGRLFPVVVKPMPDRDIPWILLRFNLLRTPDPTAASREVLKALTGGST